MKDRPSRSERQSFLTVNGGVVGGFLAYKAGLTGTPEARTKGNRRSRLKPPFGSGNLFPGAMLPGDSGIDAE